MFLQEPDEFAVIAVGGEDPPPGFPERLNQRVQPFATAKAHWPHQRRKQHYATERNGLRGFPEGEHVVDKDRSPCTLTNRNPGRRHMVTGKPQHGQQQPLILTKTPDGGRTPTGEPVPRQVIDQDIQPQSEAVTDHPCIKPGMIEVTMEQEDAAVRPGLFVIMGGDAVARGTDPPEMMTHGRELGFRPQLIERQVGSDSRIRRGGLREIEGWQGRDNRLAVPVRLTESG